jgi:hypothetical protein
VCVSAVSPGVELSCFCLSFTCSLHLSCSSARNHVGRGKGKGQQGPTGISGLGCQSLIPCTISAILQGSHGNARRFGSWLEAYRTVERNGGKIVVEGMDLAAGLEAKSLKRALSPATVVRGQDY